MNETPNTTKQADAGPPLGERSEVTIYLGVAERGVQRRHRDSRASMPRRFQHRIVEPRNAEPGCSLDQ